MFYVALATGSGRRTTMKLGLSLGYWGAGPPPDAVSAAQEAERLGYDSAWTGEAWGSDAFTPLAWIGAQTSTIKLATGVAHMSARTPAAMAMQAITLDHLSNGRLILGIGVSGPQVVEGWHGQPFAKPLARTREYVEILRRIFAREAPLEFPGEHYRLPYDGPGSVGLGKPLRSITHPLRADLPIHLGAEGPKNVRLAAEITDGWVPLYYSPWREDVYAEQIQGRGDDFDVSVNVSVNINDDVEAALAGPKMMLGFYIGGMGAKGRNFHTELMARMGFEEDAFKIQDLFFEGRREEAIAAVPSAFADEISLAGPIERVRDRLEAWKESRVTRLLIGSRDPAVLRQVAELVL
jgi:F420-dependent oxidoreductase-like protein